MLFNLNFKVLRRYRQIIGILIKYGFQDILSDAGVSLKARVVETFLPKDLVEKIHSHSKWERMRMAVEELGTTYIKLAQILSNRPDVIPLELVAEFEKTKLFNIPIPFFGTFEEINLRFYVKRIECGKVKRGVVFINETVPFKAVAWLANKLYKEHYITIPTKNSIHLSTNKQVKYEWKINGQWNHLQVDAQVETEKMAHGSMEEFIFELMLRIT